jgi:hypothetical protein
MELHLAYLSFKDEDKEEVSVGERISREEEH